MSNFTFSFMFFLKNRTYYYKDISLEYVPILSGVGHVLEGDYGSAPGVKRKEGEWCREGYKLPSRRTDLVPLDIGRESVKCIA